jgi:hypothetical protein
MQFILGVVLFAAVLGWLDSALPWPKAPRSGDSP